jgi:O-antigen/teichoic acid export membrane protein
LSSAVLTIFAFTPLADWWLGSVSALSQDLVDFALWPMRIMVFIPALTVCLAWQHGLLVLYHRTRAITLAALLEMIVMAAVLFVTVEWLGLPGAIAAGLAMVGGELLGPLFIFYILRRLKIPIARPATAS